MAEETTNEAVEETTEAAPAADNASGVDESVEVPKEFKALVEQVETML